jgi:iron complex transport system substrate-binding protein
MKSARTSRYRRARAAVVALAGAFTVAVSGCGPDPVATDSGGDAVVISHARGNTAIHGTPKRIVASDSQWLDQL